jgi:hypothetical protein
MLAIDMQIETLTLSEQTSAPAFSFRKVYYRREGHAHAVKQGCVV